MSLFSATTTTKVLALAVALGLSGTAGVEAGDRFTQRNITQFEKGPGPLARERRGPHRDRFEKRRHGRHAEHRHWRKNRNFYGGAISAYRDPGNGIYFYIDRDEPRPSAVEPLPDEGSQAKVILVTPGSDNCAWESGVCVIRP